MSLVMGGGVNKGKVREKEREERIKASQCQDNSTILCQKLNKQLLSIRIIVNREKVVGRQQEVDLLVNFSFLWRSLLLTEAKEHIFEINY